MPIEIKIGEPHLTIHHGHGVMVSDPDGSLAQPSGKGLFFRDTRLMSTWSITAQDRSWQLVNSANESFCSARVVLINPPLKTMEGELKQHTIALTIGRLFGDGLHEDVDVHNYGQRRAQFDLRIMLASDFADFFEVKSEQTFERSGITSTWSEHDQNLTNVYKRDHFLRGLVVCIRRSDSRAGFANGKIILPVSLDAGDRWHACLTYEFIDGPARFTAPACPGRRTDAKPSPQPSEPTTSRATIRSASADFDRIIRQAIDDMIALQLHVPDGGKLPIPAGGYHGSSASLVATVSSPLCNFRSSIRNSPAVHWTVLPLCRPLKLMITGTPNLERCRTNCATANWRSLAKCHIRHIMEPLTQRRFI